MPQTLLAQASSDPNYQGVDLFSQITLDGTTPLNQVFNQPSDLINLLTSIIFVIGGLILFGTIVAAGFKLLSSEKNGLEEAKNMITTGIIGMIVMFVAYWIVQILGLITGANVGLGMI